MPTIIQCLECKSSTKNKKFCSVQCSNTYNGRKNEVWNRGEDITCDRCQTAKAPNQFSYRVRGDITSGKKSHCKRCGATERERLRRARTWRDDAVQAMLNNSKQRAKRANIEHSLVKEDITIPDKCPVLGLKLEHGDRRSKAQSPSIDRIDNDRGYTKDNIVIVSYRANRLKNDATPQELILLAEYYSR